MKSKRTPDVLPVDAPERRRLPPLLRKAWYGLNQAFRRRIAHTGITPDQFTVMRILRETDGLTQRQLTGLMSSDPNTVASVLERMEKAGLLKRSPHTRDRRAHQVELLAAGHRKYEEARELAVALQTEVLQGVEEAERETFLGHLASVAEAYRAASEGRS